VTEPDFQRGLRFHKALKDRQARSSCTFGELVWEWVGEQRQVSRQCSGRLLLIPDLKRVVVPYPMRTHKPMLMSAFARTRQLRVRRSPKQDHR
jgi:hypothetical protein